MAETAATMDAFADIDEAEDHRETPLRDVAKPDRLPPMLFLAALIHGILIIGITFNSISGESNEAISLDVTIVANPERALAEPDDADYLAQASQEGQGNTLLEVRPGARPESSVPFTNPGQKNGNSLENSQDQSEAADQVLTSRTEQDLKIADRLRENAEIEKKTAVELEAGLDTTLPLPKDDETRLQIHDDAPRQLVTSVDTRESVIAGYLDGWKRKIEAIGVEYFPEQALATGHTGSPTLEVTINASGQLHEVIVRRSSGSRVLDQAALDILRRAAPFDPFPEAVRAKYDQLRFAYKWQFSERRVPAASSAATSGN